MNTTTKVMPAFLAMLLGLGLLAGMDPAVLMGDALVKFAMSAVLVVSMVPMMRAGMGLNFGMPIGVSAGLMRRSRRCGRRRLWLTLAPSRGSSPSPRPPTPRWRGGR